MKNTRLQILFGLFIALLIGMNLLGSKLTTIFGISVSVGIFMVPLTFLITDIVADVFGKDIVKKFIYIGIFTLIIIFFYAALCVYLEPNERYSSNEAYKTIFGGSLRMLIASIAAFALSQLHDIFVFEKLKRVTKGRFLWLRNNLSTMGSQLIDSTVFMFIAFYGITDRFDAMFIVSLIIPYYLFKIAIAIIDTPFVYLGVSWLKKDLQKAKVKN